MVKLLYILYKMKLLSPLGIGRLFAMIFKNGINVMTLLDFAAKTYSEKVALVDDQETISYQQLLKQSEQLAQTLFQKYHLESGQKVCLLSKNHASMVRSIFAVSRLGADLYLLNTEMSQSQLQYILDSHPVHLLIYDSEFSSKVEFYQGMKVISGKVNEETQHKKMPPTSMGKLIILTGGTTGKAKEVAHQPSLFHYLHPFLGLLTRLNLFTYHTAYIATPIFHGYGLAVLFLFLALGKKVVISKGFSAEKACELVREHKVEVVTVVPLMIKKMLAQNSEDLRSLKCIASGSAALNPQLVKEASDKLGDVLYNLFGTSEAGLNMIATPEDLHYSSTTIGRKIAGVQLRVLNQNKREVDPGKIGLFCVKNRKSAWIETGDLGYQDEKGYYFLCGRVDDMIVSGGVNVYPIELEQVLLKHHLIEDAAVIGIADERFGQRLKAFVKLNAELPKDELMEWLRPQVARFQMPSEIVYVQEIPYTPLGKLDKKGLIRKKENFNYDHK